MGDYNQYYEDRTRGRRDSNTTDYYYSRPVHTMTTVRYPQEPRVDTTQHRYEYYSSPSRRSDEYRSSSRDLVRYDERSGRSSSREVVRYSDSERRRRSLSPSHLRHQHHHHEHEHDRGHEHHHHHQRSHGEHSTGKDIAATVLGGIVGSQAGKRASHGHSKMGTAAGALIGAWGGHELEKSWEHHEEKEDRRDYR